jgi:hypothetical protein
MAQRIAQVAPGSHEDPQVNDILDSWRTAYWGDAGMFAQIAQNPPVLKAMMEAIDSFWPGNSRFGILSHLPDMMRIKTAQARGCSY